MKTIFITHNFRRTSFSEMSVDLAIHLAELGNDVIFVSYRPFYEFPEEYPTKKGKLIIYSWPTKKRPIRFVDFVFFIKLYLKHKPNIVLSHFASSNIALSVSKILSIGRVKTIDYYHTLTKQIAIDGYSHISLKIRKSLFYNLFVDQIICVSNIARIDLIDHFYYNKKKALTVLNPLPDRFYDQKKITHSNNISFIGGLNKSKGIQLLIEAFEQYLISYPESRLHLTIAGSGSLEKYVIEKAKKNQKITFMGQIPYLAIDDFIISSYAIIIPSLADNLVTVGLESLMNNRLLAVSENTGLAEYLSEEDCIKFKPEVNEIYNVLKIIENMKKMDYKIFVDNGRKKYLKLFQIEDYLKTMESILLK
jgi:glycosyltransferase involved in cell wall biosynthesis